MSRTLGGTLSPDKRGRGPGTSSLVPGQDVAAFMQHGIANANRVLMVCSDSYIRKAEAGLGGVGYERLIVTAEVVQSIETTKFVPLMRSNAACSVPRFMGPRMYVDFNDDGMYAQRLGELLRELLGVPMHPRPPVGPSPFSPDPGRPTTRPTSPTGTGQTGEPVLDDPWFEEQRGRAEVGLQGVGLEGSMEVRFAVHDPLSKSQIDLLVAARGSHGGAQLA